MKNSWKTVLATLASLVLVASIWALPPTTTTQEPAAQTQSISGKIASVAKDSFTLTLPASPQRAQAQQEPNANSPKTMTFLIDKNTTIEGKLAVGAGADVTYRDDNGSHVAVSVRVTP